MIKLGNLISLKKSELKIAEILFSIFHGVIKIHLNICLARGSAERTPPPPPPPRQQRTETFSVGWCMPQLASEKRALWVAGGDRTTGTGGTLAK